MLRRGIRGFAPAVIPPAGNLSGNGIIGIRREDKNVWERRVPLTPTHVKDLLKNGYVDKVVVQPSTIRCFYDEEYAAAGADVKEDLSDAGTIFAVKEVPGDLLMPDRSYCFFSHTIKAQPYNMPLLDTILQERIRLFDYERICESGYADFGRGGTKNRLTKFGNEAGLAGCVDTLNALGLALMARGYATPFLNVSLSREYRSLAVARESIRIAGERIREHGLPRDACPLVFGVTGSGSVSMAAQEILHLLPCKYIEVEDLPRLHTQGNRVDNRYIYVCVIKAKDMVAPAKVGRAFDRDDYYKNPKEYVPVFHERVAPYLSVLITGHYWEPRFPRMLTTEQARELYSHNRLRLLVLSDITCDIGGSIEFFVKSTSIQNPFYCYDLKKNRAMDIQDFHGDGVVILGVDHLPAEFPREASSSFGDNLKPLVPLIASSKADGVSLEKQREHLGRPLFDAMVTMGGKLTPNYEYITALRAKNEESGGLGAVASPSKKKNVLLFGSGMMSAPCVFALLESKENRVTVIDANQNNLDLMHNALRKSDHDEDESRVRFVKADINKKRDSYLETLIRNSDVVVSLLPAPMHPTLAEVTIKNNKPLVTASYVSPGMEALRAAADKSNTVVVNEMGLDPGIDLMTSAALLNKIRAEGGHVQTYISLCGALPAPENSNCPLGYKFSWSPFGVLTAATRPARVRIGGGWYDVPGDFLYWFPQPISQFKGLDLYWLPNGDVSKYAKNFGIEDAKTLVRGTIRYAGFAPCIRAFKLLGLLDNTTVLPELDKRTPEVEGLTWPSLIAECAFGSDEAAAAAAQSRPIREWLPPVLKQRLTAKWKEIYASEAYRAITCGGLMTEGTNANSNAAGGAALSAAPAVGASAAPKSDDQIAAEVDREVRDIMHSLEKLRMLTRQVVAPRTNEATPIHSLCQQLIIHLSYMQHERDYVIMYHKIVADFPNEPYKRNKERMGVRRVYDMTLTMRGKSETCSATAETVGVPVGITAQMVLNGGLQGESGFVSPTSPKVYEPVLRSLIAHGITMQEAVEDLPLDGGAPTYDETPEPKSGNKA